MTGYFQRPIAVMLQAAPLAMLFQHMPHSRGRLVELRPSPVASHTASPAALCAATEIAGVSMNGAGHELGATLPDTKSAPAELAIFPVAPLAQQICKPFASRT